MQPRRKAAQRRDLAVRAASSASSVSPTGQRLRVLDLLLEHVDDLLR